MSASAPTAPVLDPRDPPAPAAAPTLRDDIQGLRALAVTLVVAFHAGVRGLDGGYVGVDVFFVISGFLITGHLLRIEPGHPVRELVGFYGRRILRLLPVAGVVIVATVLLARLILPPLAFPAVGVTGRASALYWINIHLANTNTSYLADNSPSPFQHYWSLAVEEQFYVLWPVTLLVLSFLARGRRKAIAAVVVLGTVLSLGLSVYLTARLQPVAFFELPTRAWEFGLGALLAISAPWLLRLRGRLALVTLWAGVAAVLVATFTFDDRTPFPGYSALLPAAGAALVIAGGTNRPRGGLERIAAWGPIAWLGAASYSIYLWHWPLLIVPSLAAEAPLSIPGRVGLVGATLVLAALSYRWVEQPFRRSVWLRARAWRPFGLAMVITAITVAATTWGGTLPRLSVARDLPVWPTGATTSSAPTPSVVGRNTSPALTAAYEDQPAISSQACSADLLLTAAVECTYGNPAATRTVLLLGDSHAQQWLSAVRAATKDTDFKVVTLSKFSCPAVPVRVYNSRLGRAFTECDAWRADAMKKIRQLAPDVIIAASFNGSIGVDGHAIPATTWGAATTALFGALPEASRKLLLVDGPQWTTDRPTCLSEHLTDAAKCSTPLADLPGKDVRSAQTVAAGDAGASVLDMSTVQCPGGSCPAMMWNIEVYRDAHHVTATFARSVSSVFAGALTTAAG